MIGSTTDTAATIKIETGNPESPRMSASERARRASLARNESGRRRKIDPTTCERDYSASELEFFRAIEDYKRRSGRPFPTWSEILEVIRELGYVKAR